MLLGEGGGAEAWQNCVRVLETLCPGQQLPTECAFPVDPSKNKTELMKVFFPTQSVCKSTESYRKSKEC